MNSNGSTSTQNSALKIFEGQQKRLQLEIEDTDKQIRRLEWLVLSCVCIAILLTSPAWIGYLNGDLKLTDVGSYLSGAVGIPLSLAGLFFLYLAFLGQRKQAIAQDHQIAQNRYELSIARDDSREQRFEQTFFQLLSTYHEIVANMDLNRRDPHLGLVRIAVGKDCFEVLYRRFKEQVGFLDPTDHIAESYAVFFNQYKSDLVHYFGHLTETLSFLWEHPNRSTASRLARFLLAQMSAFEKLLLFYHALQPELSTFKCLVEDFSMLSGLPTDLLIIEGDASQYRPNAYQTPTSSVPATSS